MGQASAATSGPLPTKISTLSDSAKHHFVRTHTFFFFLNQKLCKWLMKDLSIVAHSSDAETERLKVLVSQDGPLPPRVLLSLEVTAADVLLSNTNDSKSS